MKKALQLVILEDIYPITATKSITTEEIRKLYQLALKLKNRFIIL